MNFFKFINSEFYKNVFTLSLGTIIAQIIPIIIYPILARIYMPQDFAVFALYFSIISLFDVISTGRYELAIVGQNKDSNSINLIAGMILISLLLSIVLSFIFYFFSNNICNLLDNQSLNRWLVIIPISIFFLSIYKSLNYWLIRKKAFRYSSYNKIIQKITENSLYVILGIKQFKSGLIVGDFIGRFLIVFVSVYNSIQKGFNFKVISFSKIIENLKNNFSFPKYNLLPSLLNSFSTLLPIFIISSFYSDAITGYFNFTRQILVIPLVLISTSISQVLFKQIADKKNTNEKITKDLIGIAKILGVLAILFILIILLFGKYLFEIFFGIQWIESGVYSQILVISFAIQFVVSPLSILFPAINKIKILSIWQVFYFLSISMLILFRNLSIYEFLTVYLIIDIISYSIYFILIYICAKKFDSKQALSKINDKK